MSYSYNYHNILKIENLWQIRPWLTFYVLSNSVFANAMFLSFPRLFSTFLFFRMIVFDDETLTREIGYEQRRGRASRSSPLTDVLEASRDLQSSTPNRDAFPSAYKTHAKRGSLVVRSQTVEPRVSTKS